MCGRKVRVFNFCVPDASGDLGRVGAVVHEEAVQVSHVEDAEL